MTALAILCVAILGLFLLAGIRERPARRLAERESRLRQQVLRADAEVGRAHAQARRAMHEASGQSWRTPFE